jgi:biotin synthase
MTPGQCVYDCKFCAQAAGSQADPRLLSRIAWPLYDEDVAYSALKEGQNEFRRVCLQVVHSEESDDYLNYVRKIRDACSLPLSVDVKARDVHEVREIFKAGADVVGLPMDVADPELYSEIKDGSFSTQLALLKEAAWEFRGRISTHLIIGLGETESQVVGLMEDLHSIGITVGLFAFTPVSGTRMAEVQKPHLDHYRRLQLARFLIYKGHKPACIFNEKDQISGFGYTGDELMGLVTPSAFCTSGCPDCNRPYYNETPGGVMYNFPVEPSTDDFYAALHQALSMKGGRDV